jgi:2-deoxy-D-gluconate 3-dehydrogenase
VNYYGTFWMCQAVGKLMLAQGSGKIINIGSVCSFQGGWTIPAYAAAKHGVVGLTRSSANEWAAKDINVNGIAPGYFATDLCAAILADPEREPRIRERIPAGRWGEPDDLVGPLLFLASDMSRYVHGEMLVVDGGWLGR